MADFSPTSLTILSKKILEANMIEIWSHANLETVNLQRCTMRMLVSTPFLSFR